MLETRLEMIDGAAIVFCMGRLVAGEESNLLQAVTDAQPGSSLVLDLALVESIDAGGLGALVEAYRRTDLKGIDLSVVNLQPQVEETVRLTGLDRVLPLEEQRQYCRAACL
jgi:anti-anti-sigma factor